MLEVNGLLAGKFLMVQLPSIRRCEGGTGLTLPLITPPKSATQPSDDCARAGVAVSSERKQVNSRIAIHLQLTLTRFVQLKVMSPRSITSNSSPGGTEAV